MPLNTAMPSAWRISAPAPVARTSGTTPRMNANEVIRIGRNRGPRGLDRRFEAALPCVFALLGELDDQDRVLAAKPTSTTRPIWVKMLLSMPAQATRRRSPRAGTSARSG